MFKFKELQNTCKCYAKTFISEENGHLRIHQRLFNVEMSFASNSFIIKDNIIMYISLESLLNLPFNYFIFNLGEKFV